jgi:putative ABC transport system permease protein
METFWKDTRYAVRTLRRSTGFTLAAVAALALGIGANSAIFSVVYALLLRPLPYAEPERLVMIWEKFETRQRLRNVISPANFLDWRSQSTCFEAMAAVGDFRANLTGGFEPEELSAQFVSHEFFDILRAQPQRGRVFNKADDAPGGPPVVILSHGLWQRRFGGNPSIVGQAITLNGEPATVLGIMPPGFHFRNERTEVWAPLRLNPARNYRQLAGRYLTAVARLKPNVSVMQAQSELDNIARRLEQDHAAFNKGWGVNIVGLHEQITGDFRLALQVLLGAVGFVLLIACANVANLLLTRAASRRREIAIRTSLGAGKLRLVRQLLTESVILGLLGGLGGLILAVWALDLLTGAAPKNIPRMSEVGLNWTVLAFTGAISILTGLLFGLAPAAAAARLDLHEALKEGGGRTSGARQRTRSGLVVAEIALSLILLVGSGLLLRSFWRLTHVDPGFEAENVLTMRIQLAGSVYRQAPQRIRYFQQAVDKVSALPGVTAAGAINFIPFGGGLSATGFWIEGTPKPEPGKSMVTRVLSAYPGYFRTMQIPLIRGRLFTERDTADAPRVFLINQTMVRRHFTNEDPIGKRLVVDMGDDRPGEIVGIVGDTRHLKLDDEEYPMVYYMYTHLPMGFMSLVIRTSNRPESMAGTVVAALRPLDSAQPIAEIQRMDALISETVSRERLTAALLAIFAGVALLLAAIGIYGVIAYSVTQRTQEIGIRMAVGALGRDVLRDVIRRGMTLAAAGVAIGLAAALALTRVMSRLLFEVKPADPVTFICVAGLLTAVALAACWLPARRATRIDPMEALRYE